MPSESVTQAMIVRPAVPPVPGEATREDSWAWPDAVTRDALQLIAEGVTSLAGFGVAAINVVRDDGRLQVVAVAGSDEARLTLEGARTPVASLLAELENADDWGRFKFVPHERLSLDPENEPWGWIPDLVPLDGDDAWHPLDLLSAPLLDSQGTLRGSLSIDLPNDGRRPGAAQRELLNKYAEQAGRAVVTALEREELAEQVRLARATRDVVRNFTSQLSLEKVLAESQEVMVRGFRASGMWIQTFDEGDLGPGHIYSHDGAEVNLPPELVTIAERLARRSWERQKVLLFQAGDFHDPTQGPQRAHSTGLELAEAQRIEDFMDSLGIVSTLFAPLGAGHECLGNLVLTRGVAGHEWTEVESAAALDIGHDLGRAILNARAFEREQELVRELRAVDTYKSRLIATVSHELRSPLTSILGNLELLDGAADLDTRAHRSLAAVKRGARRLVRISEDLLLLAEVGDPDNRVDARPVDLRVVVADVRELHAVVASQRDILVAVEAPDGPIQAWGDPDELDRMLANLLSNALKYTPGGRHVGIALARDGSEIVLAVSDQGIGISEHDQADLFSEFFRSTNPEAVAQPGTGLGLGLTIVKRIVTRHGGRIEVESELGGGSTFRVHLPAAPAAD